MLFLMNIDKPKGKQARDQTEPDGRDQPDQTLSSTLQLQTPPSNLESSSAIWPQMNPT